MKIPNVTIQQLLEAGVHLGHKTLRGNPKMKKYIFGKRDSIHIIDLTQTLELTKVALEKIHNTIANNGKILFVSTKKQASEAIADVAKETDQYFVNYRWLGGMLTNWGTISGSIKKMKKYEADLVAENRGFTKKELLKMSVKKDKLQRSLGGIADMKKTPDLVFIIDTNYESLAIQESVKLGIPIIAILDSNSNPDGIDFPIPGNDDARRAIDLYCNLIKETIIDAKKAAPSIETKKSIVSSVLTLPVEDRPQYIFFYKEHIAEVQDLLCYNQLVSPTEMNEVLYNLTKNYPTLIKKIQPWYKKTGIDEYVPDFEYGYNIIKSFEKRKLNGLWFRLTSLFYCKSKCCYDIDDGNPFTNKHMMAQIDKMKKDDASTMTSIMKSTDPNAMKEPIPASNLMSILAEANDGPGMSDSTSFNLLSELVDKKSGKHINNVKSRLSAQANNEINNKLSKALIIKTNLDKKIIDKKEQLTEKIGNVVEQGQNITTTINEVNDTIGKQSDETIVNINEALESDSAESSPKSTDSDNKDQIT